jgi:hypothetical protein
MKKVITVLIAFIIVTGFRLPGNDKKNKMSSFEWIIGSWTMQKRNGGAIMENWMQGNDSTLSGESLNFSVTGQFKVTETLQLVFRNGVYYYISTVKGQNNEQPVKFKITSHSENRFVAENPEHDFPKRITYNQVSMDSIHAFIDGGPSMPEKKSDFYYSRYKK